MLSHLRVGGGAVRDPMDMLCLKGLQGYMSYSLNSLKGDIYRII